MGRWNPTFREERETWGTLFRGAGQEKRATRHGSNESVEDRARELVELKPHISLPDARIACR